MIAIKWFFVFFPRWLSRPQEGFILRSAFVAWHWKGEKSLQNTHSQDTHSLARLWKRAKQQNFHITLIGLKIAFAAKLLCAFVQIMPLQRKFSCLVFSYQAIGKLAAFHRKFDVRCTYLRIFSAARQKRKADCLDSFCVFVDIITNCQCSRPAWKSHWDSGDTALSSYGENLETTLIRQVVFRLYAECFSLLKLLALMWFYSVNFLVAS